MSNFLRVIFLIFFILICTSSQTKSSSVTPAILEKADEDLPECSRNCPEYQFAQWTTWDECSGGNCHMTEGKQSRQRYCYVMVTVPPSRSDGGSKNDENVDKRTWKPYCREKQERPCIKKSTCTGEWSSWEQWAACTMTSSKNSTCLRTRRRVCKNSDGARLSGSHCYGGLINDTQNEMCRNKTCFRIQAKMAPDDKKTIIPLKTATKQKPNSINHNTILIIAVAVGSLVFGAVFVLLLLNLVRRSATRDDSSSTSSRGDRWKRIGSVNTSSGYSTSYAAASDIMSPRMDIIETRSPGSATTESNSSGISQMFFGRKDTRIIPNADSAAESSLLTISGAVNAEERPRRSRLLQENVYWEITETTSLSFDGDSEEDERLTPSESNAGDREEVQNVLYGSRV